MLVRDFFARQVEPGPHGEPPDVKLPTALKRGEDVRSSILMRLSASRRFAFGDKNGVVARRAGLRLDASQRVIVKALVSRHGQGPGAAGALFRHIAYLGRGGAGLQEARPSFFDRESSELNPRQIAAAWEQDRHHFRLIISPEHGERITDLPGYVRKVMGKVAGDLDEPGLAWTATCHFDTDQPHAHVLVRGRRADGRDLVMPRAYISHGIRARAQAAAQELLGDLSRPEAERRVWRQTQANHFTQLDRRLIAQAQADGTVSDGVGKSDAWAALTRGRLRHLERLGLAQRIGDRYRLDPAMERELRAAQLRMDIIRTINQRRLEGARDVRSQTVGRVSGAVMKSGFHDELGVAGYVIVRDVEGVEHYGALRSGLSPPVPGQRVVVEFSVNGTASLIAQRGAEAAL